HLKPGQLRRVHVIFGNADHGRRCRAKGVAQGSSLRHRRHLHHAKGDAHAGADDQADYNPLVLDQFRVVEGCANRQGSANFSADYAPARRSRRTQPLQRQNEEHNGNDVGKIQVLLQRKSVGHFLALPVLNMRNMRSVIKNPPTILLKDAATAIAPSAVVKGVSWRPAIMIAATTTMASRALVRDMRGVCRSGETRLISSNPTNPASIKTYRLEMKSAGTFPPLARLLRYQRGQPQAFPHACIYQFPALRQQRIPNNVVALRRTYLPILDQILEKRCQVLGIHLAGMIRRAAGQIDGPQNCHTVRLNSLSRLRQFTVSAALRRQIQDDRSRRHALDHRFRYEHRRLLAW